MHCYVFRELRWWPDSAEDEVDLQLRRERDLLLAARNSLNSMLTKVFISNQGDLQLRRKRVLLLAARNSLNCILIKV
jgi:hypothetical protein